MLPEKDDDRRIVVTGVGLWTPLAASRDESWLRLVAGDRAARWLSESDGAPRDRASSETRRWGGASAADRPPRDVAATIGLSAVREALAQAGLTAADVSPHRLGCVFGTSKGSFESLTAHRDDTGESTSPDATPMWLPYAPSGPLERIVASVPGIGPASCPVAACATGALAILQGARWIEQGLCDAVITGSADAAIQPALLASYRRLGVLARIEDDPATAARPFDRRRSGFVVGEGAGAILLERLSAAKQRGVTPLAEWCGGLNLSDTTSLLRGDRSGETLCELLRRLLIRTGTSPAEIDLVSLHGTGTLENDLAEGRGLRAALGAKGAIDRLSAFSLKGAIGHLLGGAGSVETVAGILALRDQVVPPTVNLEVPDPDCLPEAVRNVAVRRPLETLVKLSLGFGGHIAALQFRRWDG